MPGLTRGEAPQPAGEAAPRLVCYALHDHAPALAPARAERAWMEAFPGRYPYRCLPHPQMTGVVIVD